MAKKKASSSTKKITITGPKVGASIAEIKSLLEKIDDKIMDNGDENLYAVRENIADVWVGTSEIRTKILTNLEQTETNIAKLNEAIEKVLNVISVGVDAYLAAQNKG